ncbi:hypothetical protein Tco_0355922 [Tanacetum coccineum]
MKLTSPRMLGKMPDMCKGQGRSNIKGIRVASTNQKYRGRGSYHDGFYHQNPPRSSTRFEHPSWVICGSTSTKSALFFPISGRKNPWTSLARLYEQDIGKTRDYLPQISVDRRWKITSNF